MRPLVLALCLAALGACAPSDGMPAAPRDLGAADRRWVPPVDGPQLLSQTGLYADIAARALAPGVRRFRPQYELWSDGADKERYLYLPPGATIDTDDMNAWVFPVGTKAWKQFSKGGRVVETRLLWKVLEGEGDEVWWMSAYLWNDAGTDAAATVDAVPNARGTDHDVPAREDCASCHVNVRDVLIGPSAIGLSSPDGAGLIDELAAAGRLTQAPTRVYGAPGTGTVQQALGYLHGNCGYCHNDRAAFNRLIQFHLALGTNDLSPDDTAVYRLAIGAKMNHVMPGGVDVGIVPGRPDRSQAWLRMGTRGDEWAMPPQCTKRVDAAGMALIEGWITALPAQ